MNRKFSERTKQVVLLARLLGYKGNENDLTSINKFFAELTGLSEKTCAMVRSTHKFTSEPSAKLLKLLGDQAQHIPNLSEILTLDGSDNSVRTTRVAKKAKRKGKKTSKKVDSAPPTKPTVAKAQTVPPTNPKKAETVPPAVLTPTAPVGSAKSSSSADLVVTQVEHEGVMRTAILVPAECSYSISFGRECVITLKQ